MEGSVKIDNASVKSNHVEQEVFLLQYIAAEIDTFLLQALKDKKLFPDDALTVSGVNNAVTLSRAIREAYQTVLKQLSSLNMKNIKLWEKAPESYLPLHGQNGYMYIGNKVLGVEQALEQKKLGAVVMAPNDVANYDPNTPQKVTALKSDASGYVGMTYEQLVIWTIPDGALIEKVLLSGGTALFEQPSFEQSTKFGPHYFGIVAGCAEASRHLEFGVFALMVARLQQKNPNIWRTIIEAQDSRAWPPMATNAVGTMTQLKEESKLIKGDESVVVYFSQLVRLWAGNKYDVSIDEKMVPKLQLELKALVDEYLKALLDDDKRRLFPGFNQPLSKIMSNPVQPGEWVHADDYAKRIESARKEYTPLKT
jgi:hypothetical protein